MFSQLNLKKMFHFANLVTRAFYFPSSYINIKYHFVKVYNVLKSLLSFK